MQAPKEEELLYRLALSSIKGIGPVLSKTLVSYCGGVKAIFQEKRSRLQKIPGIGPKMAAEIAAFSNFQDLEQEMRFIEDNHIRCHFYLDESFPFRLKQIPDAPIMLFSKGQANLSPKRIVAVVGTRKPSPEGKEICRQLVQDLKAYNCTVVSGLAYGIDITAHRSALENHLPTIAVFGHGLDRIYPSHHSKTAREMLEQNGAWVTEFSSGTNPDYMNFPQRNRVVAGMCDAVVVIESARKGGSMITAELAFGYDREVMAIPGRPIDLISSGCNLLIKQQKAHLIEGAVDLAKILNYDLTEKSSAPQQSSLLFDLAPEMQKVLSHFKENAISLDELLILTRMPSPELALRLIELEFAGWIKVLPGKKYQRIRN